MIDNHGGIGKMENLKFTLPNFEGPLDLLLHMVRERKVDIRSIPISQIADEFLHYLEMMREFRIHITADFLRTASTLLFLKSKALLPSLEGKEKEEFEKEKEKFYAEVEEYQKYRELCDTLESFMNSARFLPANARVDPWTEKRLAEALKKSWKLFRSFVKEFRLSERIYELKAPKYSVHKKLEEIQQCDEVELISLLKNCTDKMEMIVVFLAVLELVKRGIFILEGEGILRKVESGAPTR